VVLENDGEDQLDQSLVEMKKYYMESKGKVISYNNKMNEG
jgi:hypothetical protein